MYASSGSRGTFQTVICAKLLQDKDGRTPLHTAASRGQTKTVKVLLDAGANKEAKDPISPNEGEALTRLGSRQSFVMRCLNFGMPCEL